jgi:sugar phosphate isomerase/epimerase
VSVHAVWPLAVHSAMLPNLTPADAISLVGAHNYQGLFWQGDLDTSTALQHTRTVPGQSAPVITTVGLGRDDRNTVDPEQAAAAAEALGATSVRICGAPIRGQTYTAAYDATLRLCEVYSQAAQRRGLKVLLHQRWGTLTQSASQLHRVLSNFDPAVVGCVYDAGSMTIEGYEEYRIGLEILGSYVADVHIANTRHFPSPTGTVWEWEWSPLSDGLLDLQRLFRALRRSGYQGWITLADRSLGQAAAALLEADRHMLQQAIDDFEGVGSHNPLRPLDDHVDRADRPDRAPAAPLEAGARA